MPATTSTIELYEKLGAVINAFTDGVTTVASLIGSGASARLYADSAPDFQTWPGTYAVMRIINNVTSDFGSGDRLDFDIEIMIFARPRGGVAGQIRNAHKLADLIEGAFLRYTLGTTTDGLIYITGRTRDALPAGTGDIDREVIQLRLVFSALTWPMYLINRP